MRVHNFAFLHFVNSHAHTLYYTKLITLTIRSTDCAPVHIFFVILNEVLRPTERRQHAQWGAQWGVGTPRHSLHKNCGTKAAVAREQWPCLHKFISLIR